MSNWSYDKYFEIFKMVVILESWQTFFSSEVIPEVEYAVKIAKSISDILSFWSMLLAEILAELWRFKI